MQDEKIVELYFSRDELALKETEAKYGKYLFKIAFDVLADISDSEESVNDTYLAAWNSIPPNKPTMLSTYLGKLTRRISIDIFRKKISKKRNGSQYALSVTELEDCVKSTENMEEEMENKALGLAINDFLRTLSKESRVLFVGRYYFCDSLKEVARYAGVSESKAKSNLFRTRQKLKDYLLKEGFEI
ncbi:MAG: sigma-70 family RNA polymerase sigma factor [Ruminococcus sp.]|nr:sigma-70 family RNA polymerase sigma factor [Ruminococcus sp.]